MNKTAFSILGILSLAAAFGAGAWHNEHGRAEAAAPAGEAAEQYACPMHPEIVTGHPGDCPACGMPLVPRRVEDAPVRPGHDRHVPGSLGVDARKQQLTGIQVVEVAPTSGPRSLRVGGRVAADETRSFTVNAGVDGFIRDVSAATTGTRVRKGQVLATFSSPDAIPAIQAYIVALNAMDRLRESGAEGAAQAHITSTSSNLQQRVEKLQDLGMSDRQIAEMERTKLVPKAIEIVAPADGLVLSRSISSGQRFSRGTEWYRIGDLGRVWIMADILGSEGRYVRPDIPVTVSVPDVRRSVAARVTDVVPQFDAVTRAMKVRLEVDNPDYLLRPDMLVDVELPLTLPETLAVPGDSIVDTGVRKVVFVERTPGVFEPRQVETGWRLGDQVEVVRGLEAGDRIAVSGTFLLESESRMRLASR